MHTKLSFFCLHNVVLDFQKLIFSPFLGINFFKNFKTPILFCGKFLYALIHAWLIENLPLKNHL